MNEKEKILDQLIEHSESVIKNIRCVKDTKYIISLSIYLTIIDTAHDISLLYKKKRLVSITTLLRGVIDSLYDLISLREDINNANFLFYTDIKNRVKLIKPKLNSEMPDYIQDDEERNKVRELLKNLKSKLKQLEIEGYASGSHKDKFVRVNAEYFHRTVFQYFNVEVHNSISSIEKRHFKIGPDGRIKISYLQEYTEDEYPVFNFIGLSLLFAFTKINQILDLNSENDLKKMISLINSHLENITVNYDDLIK